MKKFHLLIALCALTAASISASGYVPLVADGKQWHEKDRTEAADYDFCYTIDGDTLVDGETWKKLILTLTVTPSNELGLQYGESADGITVNFTLDKPTNVSLNVMELNGVFVCSTASDKLLESGTHSYTITLERNRQYLVQLILDGRVNVRKIMVK